MKDNYNNNNIIDEIKSRCNIVDVVGRVVTLKKAGSNYKGQCPFHNEKTPSFIVSEAKQIFTCFGCGATGDVIEFVKKYNNIDFLQAVEKLADECGISIEKDSRTSERKAVLYQINREAALYYYKIFQMPGNPGRDYMEKRGIAPETLKKFGIGYAEDKWDGLYNYLKRKGFSEERMLELGLISQSNGKYYDKFRNRVIFPILNTTGKIIGFGGRAIGDQQPKYLNSPETPVFQKKNNLYGLNLTRQEIGRKEEAILVEGYMDVISLYQGGIKNVVASLGTALTENQGKMLRRYAKRVFISYDSDSAGQAAALRAIDILHQQDCKPAVVSIEGGKDPDEYIKKNGKDSFEWLLKTAKPFAEYKLSLLIKDNDIETTEGRVDFLQKAVLVLKDLSPVEADVYIRKLSEETHISQGAIRKEMGQVVTPVEQFKPKESVNTSLLAMSLSQIEKNLIRFMTLDKDYYLRAREHGDVFISQPGHRIFEAIQGAYVNQEILDIQQVYDMLEENERVLLREIQETISYAGREEEAYRQCERKIQIEKYRKREKELNIILSMLDEEENVEEIEKITKELIEIQLRLKS